MTPAARVAAAIAVIDRWRTGAAGLDRVLAGWGRENRYAGSGDRRAIADLVYDTTRRLRSAFWVTGGGPEDGRAALIGSLTLDGCDLAGLFDGSAHAPAPLTEAETAALRLDLDTAPRGVRLDLPDWLLPDLSHLTEDALTTLRQRAPLDLRVNRLKADPAAALAALAEDGIAATPVDLAPLALRITSGARRVAACRAYLDGLVEIQDAASQAAAAFAEAEPGETVLDFCAGGGGKTLALGADMGGKGRLLAHDADPHRLKQLAPRAARAGLKVETVGPRELPSLADRCDLVFVDAPCSGSGAWRRNPDAKWRLSRQRLRSLMRMQAQILDQASVLVRPGGRFVYATCSLFPGENAAQIDDFLSRRRDIHVDGTLDLPPNRGGDGFFAARLVRSGSGCSR